MTPEVKKIIEESPFLALATNSKAGQTHLIVVGKTKEIRDDNCAYFGQTGHQFRFKLDSNSGSKSNWTDRSEATNRNLTYGIIITGW
ncbi:MAG: hypothetical protein ACM3YE_10430 [Bacteroidota bacterium]